MLVHASVTGYYDWVPCPDDVEITPEDVAALRVKQMSDGKFHMKVEMSRDTHHDTRIPELAITDRMASLELLGRPQSREATVAEILAASFRHHIHTKHIVEITIDDDGPNADVYKADLKRLGVTGEKADEALANYMEQADLTTYLNVVFKAKGKK